MGARSLVPRVRTVSVSIRASGRRHGLGPVAGWAALAPGQTDAVGQARLSPFIYSILFQ
jgi:hypothetical protein